MQHMTPSSHYDVLVAASKVEQTPYALWAMMPHQSTHPTFTLQPYAALADLALQVDWHPECLHYAPLCQLSATASGIQGSTGLELSNCGRARPQNRQVTIGGQAPPGRGVHEACGALL